MTTAFRDGDIPGSDREGKPLQQPSVRAHDGPGEVLITPLGIVDGWTVQQWVLLPGCGEGPHRHGDDGVQLERYRVLAGQVVLTVEGQRRLLRPDSGDQVVDPTDHRAVVNECPDEAVLQVAFQLG